MTATAAENGGYAPLSEHDAMPAYLARKLPASSQAGRGQFLTVNLSTGYAALNDGTVPGQIPAGICDPSVLSDTSSTAGAAQVRLSQRWSRGIPSSTIANDSFADTDWGVPFWIKDENTPGKLSNYSGSNRSLGGLVFGLAADGTPLLWTGPVAGLVARSTLVADTMEFAWFSLADAAASDTIAERTMQCTKLHGTVASIEFVGAAVPANNTDYITLTVSKRDGAGGGAVVLGTYDSRAANQGAVTAFVPATFSLSAVAGALNLLPTDIITITEAKGGAGKALTGVVRVNGKVI